ncbi:uncharacterized protein [Palaemon carinicauda]|uniref:uncharacterized protein n=1 Tax=Palaemon carinicauda TaxID=392227 RepID=UPI0035B6357D
MGNLDSTMQLPSENRRMVDIADAALKGNLKRLSELTNEGLQSMGGLGNQAWLYAVMNNFSIISDMIAALIKNGANINAKNDKGLTALHLAASGKHPVSSEVVRVLLNHGADTTAVDENGNTPLHHGIFCYDEEVPAMLVDKTKKVSPTSSKQLDDWARLSAEACGRDLYNDIIPSLIQVGKNVNAKNSKGQTPLHLACSCGHPFAFHVARTLIDLGAEVNVTDNNDETPLHQSVRLYDEKVARVLLERGAKTEVVNNIGTTALSFACLYDRTHDAKITRLLLLYGADPNARQYNGSFPITYAVSTEFSGVAKVNALVDHKVNLGSTGPNGMTALFAAVCNNHDDTHEIVRALVRCGMNPNHRLDDGKTLLHMAVTNRNTKVVELLIELGADVNVAENIGHRPLHCLGDNTFPNVTEVAKLLISHGAYVNITDLAGFTPLHSAASMGNETLVRYLVEEAGAKTTLKNNREYTPLKLASENGFRSIVEYLLTVTPGVSTASEVEMNTESLEDLLIAAARHGRLRTVQGLIADGANLAYRDPSTFLTIEEIAHMRGHSDVAWFANKALSGTVRGIRQRPEMDLCKSSLGLEDQLAMLQSNSVDSFVTIGTLTKGINDIHYQDDRGMTHLHVLVEKKNVVGTFILLGQHALITARTHNGLTPLDLANKMGLTEIAEKLTNRLQTFQDNEFTSDVVKLRYYTMLLSIINHCISIPSKYENNDPEAQTQKLLDLKNASWLISLGAPLEPPGSHHASALHLAITTNCKPILTMLLAADAPLYVTHNGLGPVETAWLTPDVTTWVAVTVTRAMVNKLKSNVPTGSNNSSDKRLAAIINSLISSLNSHEPWKAKYHCVTNSSRITKDVIARACEKGLTLPLWWMWSRKANSFQEDSTDRTPLHIALDEHHYETAKALVIHMKVNPFIPDNLGRVPMDLFPLNMKTTIVKQCLMREFQHFDGNIQWLKDPTQIREEQELALLLLSLFVFWNKPNREIQWQDFHWGIVSLLPASDVINGKPYLRSDWIACFIETLKETGKFSRCTVEIEITDYYKGLGNCGDDLSEFLDKLNKEYYMINEPEEFHILLCILETLLHQAMEKKIHFGRCNANYVPSLLKKGFKRCCERKLPLFLHLLVQVAKVHPNIVIDDICQTTAIHHTAMKDNMSATMYLKASGFDVRKVDKYGRTPSHFAYMYGNKDIGDYLKPRTEEIQTDSGLVPEDMWNAYKKYMTLYGIDLQTTNKPEFNECNNSDDLISLHLNALLNKWGVKGITDAVKKAKVDYSLGESREVFTCIKNFLMRLISSIGEKEPLLTGKLTFVGSSEDDVRLITPDEYDCNLVLDNFNCLPGGGCRMMLQEIGSKVSYVDKKICISFDSPELQDLFQGTNLLIRFSEAMKECLQDFPMEDRRLSITPPSMKQTLVGIALRFSWNGNEFPLLLIDVDIVPVVRALWPSELKKPVFTPEIKEVFINKLGRDEWRFSFAQAENMIMKKLSQDEKIVYLACKMIIGSMKTEGWMQQQLKDQFQFWDGRKMKIPLPNGFLLKSSFFFEKEEVTDKALWKERELLDRMCSIFRRMCSEMEKDSKSVYVPGKVEAYFGRTTQEQGVGYGAPEILKFLENWIRTTNIIGCLYDYFMKEEITLQKI